MADENPKTKRGRPKNKIGTKVEQRLVKFTLNASECIRENINFLFILQFHAMRAAGMHAKWILNDNYLPVGIEVDPNPLLPTPTSAERSESLKFITQYGWGQPVQSTQVDIDIRHRLDQMGSGATNQAIEGRFNPESLMHLKKALGLAMLPPPQGHEGEIIDAEFTETNDENPVTTHQNNGASDRVEENNPLPEPDSGDSDNQ